MRGQKYQEAEQMRRGRTIVAEREQVESESERMQARRKAHRKKTTAGIIVILMAIILALSAYLGMKELTKGDGLLNAQLGQPPKALQAQFVDEDNRGQISGRMQEYLILLEEDFHDLGYTVTRMTLPTGSSREVYVDFAEREGYVKVSIDRGSAVSAEDAVRMFHYLDERDLHPAYIDVRLPGKAYYK